MPHSFCSKDKAISLSKSERKEHHHFSQILAYLHLVEFSIFSKSNDSSNFGAHFLCVFFRNMLY